MLNTIRGVRETVKDTLHEIHSVGFVQGMNKLKTMQGLEKIALVVIPALQMIKYYAQQTVDGWIEILNVQYELYSVSLIIPATNRMLNKDISVRRSLFFMQILCRFGSLLNKSELVDLTALSNLAESLGKYKIFQNDVASYFLSAPRDFFIFCSAVWDLGLLLKAFSSQKLTPYQKRIGFLHTTYCIGRIAVITLQCFAKNNPFPYMGGLYFIDFGTQLINLFKMIIK